MRQVMFCELKFAFRMSLSAVKFKMVDSSRGARIMVINDFTFRKASNWIWICTDKFKYNCQAKVRLEGPESDTVMPYPSLEHNHPPPRYQYVTKGGQYIKFTPGKPIFSI